MLTKTYNGIPLSSTMTHNELYEFDSYGQK